MGFIEAFGWWVDAVEFFAANIRSHHMTLLQYPKNTIVKLAMLVIANHWTHIACDTTATATATIHFLLCIFTKFDVQS